MLKTLFSKFLRIIKKNKLDFFLNLIGLSVAMVVFIFVTLYVKNEISYDSYHTNADRIFRITTSLTSPSGQTTDMALANPPFSQILKTRCPEIEEVVCVETEGGYTFTYDGNKYDNINARKATPSIFKVFSYPVISGNPSTFLKSPNTIILTESLSKNIFGETPPLGRKIEIGKQNYEVTGVMEDLPTNTDLQFTALLPSEFDGTGELVDWGDYYIYMKTVSPDVSTLNKKIEQIASKEYKELLEQLGGYQLVHNLQPLESIHFDNSLLADTPKGNKTTVYVFSVVAFLILLIAGINYNNLTLAQLEKRQNEFSIKKIIGCGKRRIIYDGMQSSIINIILATLVSIILATYLHQQFNYLFNKNLDVTSIFRVGLPLLGFFILFGILIGIYPALKTIKSSQQKTGFGFFGKTLVTFQYTITIIMIAGLFLIWNQVKFMKNADLGFNKEQVIAISIPGEPEKFPGKEVLNQNFSALPEIQLLSFGGGGTNLGNSGNWMKAIIAEKDEHGNDVQFVLNQPSVDENYIDLLGIEIIEGRNFSAERPADAEKSVIINEAYAGVMGWDNPVGKIIDEDTGQEVIGLIKDFHFTALNNPIEPLMFQMLNKQPSYLFIKTNPENLKVIQKQWESIYSDDPFEYQFMDKHMASLYQKEEKEMSIFTWLTVIAILISCLGIYGLASHFIINRTKEIGVRKVNGAKVGEVITLLNRGFIQWVIIAFVIATPVAYFVLNKWLENFAYKTDLSWWIFALAGLLALGIAMLTVSWKSWRAASENPIEALRYE